MKRKNVALIILLLISSIFLLSLDTVAFADGAEKLGKIITSVKTSVIKPVGGCALLAGIVIVGASITGHMRGDQLKLGIVSCVVGGIMLGASTDLADFFEKWTPGS